MSSALTTYWKPFRVFDNTTLTESDERVRVFLNLDYEENVEENVITLNVKGRNNNEAWFILRTHGDEIESINGATYKEIEKNAYLLTITEDVVNIELKNSQKIN